MNLLAIEFALRLYDEIGADSYAEMRRINATDPQHSCASHYYCDATIIMADAYEAINGHPVDFRTDYWIDDFNAAWSAFREMTK
jgi:hypothetical protein